MLALLTALSPAEAQQRRGGPPPEMQRCEGTDPSQMRTCHQENLRAARRQLDLAITEACRKQGAKGGDIVACRTDMMMKAADNLRSDSGGDSRQQR